MQLAHFRTRSGNHEIGRNVVTAQITQEEVVREQRSLDEEDNHT